MVHLSKSLLFDYNNYRAKVGNKVKPFGQLFHMGMHIVVTSTWLFWGETRVVVMEIPKLKQKLM